MKKINLLRKEHEKNIDKYLNYFVQEHHYSEYVNPFIKLILKDQNTSEKEIKKEVKYFASKIKEIQDILEEKNILFIKTFPNTYLLFELFSKTEKIDFAKLFLILLRNAKKNAWKITVNANKLRKLLENVNKRKRITFTKILFAEYAKEKSQSWQLIDAASLIGTLLENREISNKEAIKEIQSIHTLIKKMYEDYQIYNYSIVKPKPIKEIDEVINKLNKVIKNIKGKLKYTIIQYVLNKYIEEPKEYKMIKATQMLEHINSIKTILDKIDEKHKDIMFIELMDLLSSSKQDLKLEIQNINDLINKISPNYLIDFINILKKATNPRKILENLPIMLNLINQFKGKEKEIILKSILFILDKNPIDAHNIFINLDNLLKLSYLFPNDRKFKVIYDLLFVANQSMTNLFLLSLPNLTKLLKDTKDKLTIFNIYHKYFIRDSLNAWKINISSILLAEFITQTPKDIDQVLNMITKTKLFKRNRTELTNIINNITNFIHLFNSNKKEVLKYILEIGNRYGFSILVRLNYLTKEIKKLEPKERFNQYKIKIFDWLKEYQLY